MFDKLRVVLNGKDKQFLLILLCFSIFISLLETIGISIIMPFISVASNFSLIHSNSYYHYFYTLFHFSNEINFVVAFGLVLIGFYIFRSGVNLFYFYLLSKFARGRYHLLAYRLFESYMGMSYRLFINQNSSNLTKAIINEAQNLTQLIAAFLFMMSEIFVVLFIYFTMLYINWKITFLLTFVLVFNAYFLVKFMTPKIKSAGIEREKHQKSFYDIINNTLGNFKLIKLKPNNKNIIERFEMASDGFAKANILNETLSHFPRLFLEAIGFSIVTFIVIYLVFKYEHDISSSLALISMFVLGLYRLMPSANRILSSYNQIIFYKNSLDIVHENIMYESENLSDESISFQKEIILKNISFEYQNNKPILKNLNLLIEKGDSIAIIGESGSGKSTLIDLLIGLYKPLKGEILVDGIVLNEMNVKNWRVKVGYIPQNIYLFEGSVAENVAFGEKIDKEKVKNVLEQANILEFLTKKQNGIETLVGDNGIKLSGGQKQRIAIARALYTNPEILVLDEATSALDTDTEAKIMDEIYKIGEDKTLIVISHRLSILYKCTKSYRLVDGIIESN